MKKLLLVLVPITLFAQVQIDTVIRGLPSQYLGQSLFIPELHKLYIVGKNQYLVLDCSTYQVKAQIPATTGRAFMAWNWRRQKLYVDCNPYPDSTVVIDAAADSIVGWLACYRDTHSPPVYVADVDRVYKPELETLYAFDCAADTIVRRIVPPSGFGIGAVSWDSVDRKLLCGGGVTGQAKLAVYNYVADSFVKVMNVGNASGINCFLLSYAQSKAYFAPYGPEPWGIETGIFDTEHDTVVGLLPALNAYGVYDQVAVDERDGKAYVAGCNDNVGLPDTLWVVDCATDSVLKKIEYQPRGFGACRIRWVPWSDRIYLSCDRDHDEQTLDSNIVVLDCNTDSIIVPGLQLGHHLALDIQLDSVRQRIFVIGADSGTITVLRDTGYGGIAQAKPTGPRPSSGLQVQMTPGGYEVRYSVAVPCRVTLSVHDLMGREVRQLVAGQQPAGEHGAFWDYRDKNRASVASGVYFVRLTTTLSSSAGPTATAKVVVTR